MGSNGDSTSMPPSETSNVLVVGAGPVGLLVALRLAKAGIRVDIIEKEDSISDKPRAAAYYGAALIALKRAGLLEYLSKVGFVVGGLCWRTPIADDGKGGKKLGDIIARLPFPSKDGFEPSVIYPQAELAKLCLDDALVTGFARIHYGKELCGVEQDEDSVTVTTKTRDNEEVTFRASFLVGTDGGKSATRKLLGIPFKGHSWPDRILANDVLLNNDGHEPDFPASFTVDPIHFGVIVPLRPPQAGKKTLYRCTVAIDPADPRTDDELVTKSSRDFLLDKLLPGSRPLDIEPVWSSVYRIHQLCAATFRRGRCILAGDAAHLNNPFGAMGLTTGLIDADAAADALEMIINENVPLSVLDIYAQERRRIFQTFTDPLSSLNKLRCASDPAFAADDWFFAKLQNASSHELEEFNKPFFDVWRADIRKIAEQRGIVSTVPDTRSKN